MLSRVGCAIVGLACVAEVGTAQEPAAQTIAAPKVYFDCQDFFGYCDFNYTRQEMPYLNWVRDRQDADIHVLITFLQTGGGGRQFSMEFIGLGPFAGRRDTLHYTSDGTDSTDEIRTGVTRTVKLGLAPFLAGTPLAERLDVTYTVPESASASQVAASPEDDPWNFWVFTISANGYGNGESQQRSFDGYASVGANRTTDAMKLDLEVSGSGSRSEFDVLDSTVTPILDTTYVSTRASYYFEGLAVGSLSDHWSAGLRASASRSTRLNQDLAVRAGPAVEYNLYPYSESSRRQITAEYSVGFAAFDYGQITVYDKLSEVHPTHRLRLGAQVTQPWGTVNLTLTGTQFLQDLSKHNVNLFGSVNLRLVRGLNFRIGGSIARIKDQLYISRAGLTPEEVLLEIRNRQTNFSYFASVGLSFRFGSKFANVVNTRMGGGGGIIIF